MKMDVMKLKTYNQTNVSMLNPGSWGENEGVRCYLKFTLDVRLHQISLKTRDFRFHSAFGLTEQKGNY